MPDKYWEEASSVVERICVPNWHKPDMINEIAAFAKRVAARELREIQAEIQAMIVRSERDAPPITSKSITPEFAIKFGWDRGLGVARRFVKCHALTRAAALDPAGGGKKS